MRLKKILLALSTILIMVSCSTLNISKKLYRDGYYISAKHEQNKQQSSKNQLRLKADTSKSTIVISDNNERLKAHLLIR